MNEIAEGNRAKGVTTTAAIKMLLRMAGSVLDGQGTGRNGRQLLFRLPGVGRFGLLGFIGIGRLVMQRRYGYESAEFNGRWCVTECATYEYPQIRHFRWCPSYGCYPPAALYR